MIVAGLYNQDSSFFEIESDSIKQKIVEQDIISFTYDEETYRLSSGNLQLLDNNNYYSKIFKVGTKLTVSFGYKKPDHLGVFSFFKKENPDQVFGAFSRTGIKGIVQSPSGGGNSSGVITFNCNFLGSEFLNKQEYRVHTGITRGALVTQLLQEIGCKDIFVNFTRQNELLDRNSQILQRETNYRFLRKYAFEWGALFRISYNVQGLMSGLFISPSLIETPKIATMMSGALGGNSIFLEYKRGVANVIDFSWQNHIANSGAGSSAHIVTQPDGSVTILRYVSEGDTVVVYRLRPDIIKKELGKVSGVTQKFKKYADWMSAKDFDSVKWAFEPVKQSTAPEGLGYTMSARVMGNPLISAPLKVIFGQGFPVWFSPEKALRLTNFYAQKVSHNIDSSGYKCKLDVQDAYTITGGSLV